MIQTSIFDLEVKEKKAQASQLRAKTNGRRNRKSMLPSDFMTKAQLKEYIKGGEIVVTNLWDNLITLEQYEALSDEKKKQALEHWRKVHSVAKIKEALKMNDYKIYKEFDRLGVFYEKRTQTKKRTATVKEPKPAAVAIQPEPAAIEPAAETTQPAAAQALQILPAMQSGSTFFLDDIYTAEEAINKLMKYAAFLEGETNKFRIRFEIAEVKE